MATADCADCAARVLNLIASAARTGCCSDKNAPRAPGVGKLIRGQRLSQIFTVLALTQSAGISFLQGLESVEER
jgi:protein transport protein HofC